MKQIGKQTAEKTNLEISPMSTLIFEISSMTGLDHRDFREFPKISSQIKKYLVTQIRIFDETSKVVCSAVCLPICFIVPAKQSYDIAY